MPSAVFDPAANPPATRLVWPDARRIIRSRHPPIDLFEDIADPADWPLLIAAEQKTNPRLAETIGLLDLVPPARRVAGPGASWLMAPFTHVSPDRPSRFSAGHYGVLYVARAFETAVLETIHHHTRFMAATSQPQGWTSQFRELVLDVDATLRDLRALPQDHPVLSPSSYAAAQALGARLRHAGADGVVYPSVRHRGGVCAGLYYPDCAARPRQARHLDYHWNGTSVDYIRDATSRDILTVSP